MTTKEASREIEVINAPWHKEVTISESIYEGGFKMFHVRIKEGKRFTDLELDAETASHIADLMGTWAKDNAVG